MASRQLSDSSMNPSLHRTLKRPGRDHLAWQTLLMAHRKFNFAQRLVVVLGLGAVLYLIGSWATSLDSFYGWVGYAPLSTGSATYGSATSAPFGMPSLVSGLHPWVRLVIWLVLIAVWVGVSLVLLRSPSPETVVDEPLQ